ncbi:hypothetical protein GN244_ATG03039 [Phytophthora infestans]|uniref:Uncharacterized protein n=1 Tax=Phytophthora infestans TaxID=4787 RepID=A0A833T739_PHYIN|nr:hypothetical protein GN244_ATG03039 [Phytophthora infestans]KAF4132690.1 hypothetical protein GN958_ATG18102 [Phytophthora infestans]
MDPDKVNELAKQVAASRVSLDSAKGNYSLADGDDAGDLPLTVLNWKMQLGQWGGSLHWFLRDIMPPQYDRPGLLTAQLMAGFESLEVQIEVNSSTSVDTVGQVGSHFTRDNIIP